MPMMKSTSDFQMVTKFEGATVTAEGDIVTFRCNVDGEPHDFAIETADAYIMGVYLISSCKAARLLMEMSDEEKLRPGVENKLSGTFNEVLAVMTKHLGMGKPEN